MDPSLTESLDRIVAHFRADSRCVGIYLWGSLGAGTADPHSDVDVALVIRDEEYVTVRDELRPLCDRLCGPTLVWLPEGETPDFCNYAFLFEAEDRVLLYDLQVMRHSAFLARSFRPDRILFDQEVALSSVPEVSPIGAAFDPARLLWLVDNYWVYAYLNGKYFLRGDLYKLLYVQQSLFQTHMRVLNALWPGERWTWWAADMKRLDSEHREALLAYFGATTVEAVCVALEQELDLFSADARTASAHHGLEYPTALEAGVRRHLLSAGVLRLQ